VEAIKSIQKAANFGRDKALEVEAAGFVKLAKTSVAQSLLGLFLNTLPCRLSASVDLLDSARRAFDYERASLEHRRHPLAAIRRRNRELRLDSLF
ncbi:hypothetical protein ABTE06_19970, partial [Acinetobacter baumannii]